MYEKIKHLFEKLQDMLWVATGIALAAMMCVIILQTFTRFVIFYSLPWSEELSRYLFVFIIMIGLNVAIRENMLIKIDAIDLLAKGKARAYLHIVHLVIALLVSAVIAYSSTTLFKIGLVQKSPAMHIPMLVMYGVVFTGYALAAVSTMFQLIDALKALAGGKNPVGGE